MPKLKTKRTLAKRIRVTKNGKVMKKQNANGHLKSKMSSGRRNRKRNLVSQPNEGHINKLLRLLGLH